MRQLFPKSRFVRSLRSVYGNLDLPAGPSRPFVAINMVTTVDGRAQVNGGAHGIGTTTDHTLMGLLRTNFQAILSGANTLRTEGFGPELSPENSRIYKRRFGVPQPIAVIVSQNGEFDLTNDFFRIPNQRRIVLTHKREVILKRELGDAAEVRGTDGTMSDCLRILESEFDIRTVLCEGGPTINAAFVREGCADELFWSVAPKLVAGSALNLIQGDELNPLIDLTLISSYLDENELYLRYRLLRAS